MNGVQIRIRGKVQGVGFRPFVWQLAQESARCGDVCNDGDGVLVRLLGDEAAFLAALTRRCPPLARIDSVETRPFHWRTLPQDVLKWLNKMIIHLRMEYSILYWLNIRLIY